MAMHPAVARRLLLVAALLAQPGPTRGHGAEIGAVTARVFGSANAWFYVYAQNCAPSFYRDAAFQGAEPTRIEVTLATDIFRTQYGGDCQQFYDDDVIYRHMGAIIYSGTAFPEGRAGLAQRDAEIYGEEFWIRMTAARNACGTGMLDDIQFENRALRAIRDKARIGDLMPVARGVIDTFKRMQSRGFSAFLTVAERCRMVRDSARSLVRTLIAEGRLGANEVEL